MKRILFVLFAVLFIAGIANAAIVYDPKTGSGIELISVYNNSASTLDAGDVVVWAATGSTGDNDAYVTTTTTANTFLVAGVVYPADIAAYDVGSIAVKGIVAVDTLGNSEGTALCSSGTAGAARPCGTAATTGYGLVGISTAAATAATGTVNVILKVQ